MSFFDPYESLSFNLNLNSRFDFVCFKCCACCYNRHIEINNFEMLHLAQHLNLPLFKLFEYFLHQGSKPWIRNKNDGSCIFLHSSGCSIYPVRPLVCRLYPLGLLFGPEGEEKWGLMPLHPDCLGLITNDRSVEDYLISQAAIPYLQYERLLRKLKRIK